MAKRPDLQRLVEFQQLLYKFRGIQRTIHFPPDAVEAENDAEHSYMLAMSAWYLVDYFPELDKDKVIRMALAHDLVEVHAGDTFVYGHKKHLASKKAREAAALKQLKAEWSDFPDMLNTIKVYETLASTEAKFVYALDKILPIFMNYLSQGRLWHQYHITFEAFLAEKQHKVALSPEIDDYFQQIVEFLQKHQEFFPK